jgi:hypothetical protein
MTSPSLLANPIMGLTGERPLVRDLLAHHRHVYFSDLREVRASGLSLTGRLFYGCVVGPETFTGAVLDGARFVCCVGHGEPWPDDDVRKAIYEGLADGWQRAWALLETPTGLTAEAIERLVAVSAIGMLDAHWGVRLDSMTYIARFLQRHPAQLAPDTRQVMEAFLLYRTADKSDMVFYDAARLVDDLKVSQGALEHLVGRARSLDPQERIAALEARYRIHYTDKLTPYPPLAELLEDDDPEVQLELLDFLSQCVHYSWDVEDLLPGVDLPAKLNRFLRSSDEHIRRRAISYTRDHGNSSNREALISILRGPNEAVRDAAFDALCCTLDNEELQAFLLEHEATPAQRAKILEYERRRRERLPNSGYLIEAEDLLAMLTSNDPRRRRDALVLAGYTGDPAWVPDAERALGDEDPRVRAEAERALRFLRDPQAQVSASGSAREAQPVVEAEVTRPQDDENCVTIAITATLGGPHADDWIETLAHMYTRWASMHRHEVGTLHPEHRDPVIKPRALWFTLRGPGVLDTLRGEHGVHGVVGLDQECGRRFAAFASVVVVHGVHNSPLPDMVVRGNQIRTYVRHPVPQVTDHRTGVVVDDAEAVLDGALDPLLISKAT